LKTQKKADKRHMSFQGGGGEKKGPGWGLGVAKKVEGGKGDGGNGKAGKEQSKSESSSIQTWVGGGW